jgi:hypothetical protein
MGIGERRAQAMGMPSRGRELWTDAGVAPKVRRQESGPFCSLRQGGFGATECVHLHHDAQKQAPAIAR